MEEIFWLSMYINFFLLASESYNLSRFSGFQLEVMLLELL